MENRKQFTMYESIYKSLQRIRNKKDRADAYDAICAYALYNQEPNLETASDAVAIAFELTRPVLDSARKKAESGKQGGSKQKAKCKQTTREKENEGEKEVEGEKENEEEIEKESLSDNLGAHKEKAASSNAPAVDCRFDSFWNAYPKNSDRHRDAALSAWKQLNPNEDGVAHIMSQLRLWKQSERWLEEDGRYIPKAEAFLDPKGEYLTKKPASGKQGVPKGATGELGEAELAAIQRVLREDAT